MQRKVKTVVLKMEMKNHKIDRVTDLTPSHESTGDTPVRRLRRGIPMRG